MLNQSRIRCLLSISISTGYIRSCICKRLDGFAPDTIYRPGTDCSGHRWRTDFGTLHRCRPCAMHSHRRAYTHAGPAHKLARHTRWQQSRICTRKQADGVAFRTVCSARMWIGCDRTDRCIGRRRCRRTLHGSRHHSNRWRADRLVSAMCWPRIVRPACIRHLRCRCSSWGMRTGLDAKPVCTRHCDRTRHAPSTDRRKCFASMLFRWDTLCRCYILCLLRSWRWFRYARARRCSSRVVVMVNGLLKGRRSEGIDA